jgi:hypothetical protein
MTISLSTRWLTPFKFFVYLIYSGLLLAIVWTTLDHHQWLWIIWHLALYGYLFYRLVNTMAKLYRVEFDNEYLYVLRKKNDVLIPLANINSIEIKTLGGIYKVNLSYPDVLGNRLYFKPSLLYPFNHKKKDALVNVLRDKIVQAKKRNPDIQANALQS